MICEYCTEEHTHEPCGLCSHPAHIHERCNYRDKSGKCGCICYMTAEQAEQNAEDYIAWDNDQF